MVRLSSATHVLVLFKIVLVLLLVPLVRFLIVSLFLDNAAHPFCSCNFRVGRLFRERERERFVRPDGPAERTMRGCYSSVLYPTTLTIGGLYAF